MTAKKTISAYEFNWDVIRNLVDRGSMPNEAFLVFRVLKDGPHSLKGLQRMGYDEKTTDYL